MITAIGTDKDGHPLVVLGLTDVNVARLTDDEPIRVPAAYLESLGFEHPVTIVIVHGGSEKELQAAIQVMQMKRKSA